MLKYGNYGCANRHILLLCFQSWLYRTQGKKQDAVKYPGLPPSDTDEDTSDCSLHGMAAAKQPEALRGSMVSTPAETLNGELIEWIDEKTKKQLSATFHIAAKQSSIVQPAPCKTITLRTEHPTTNSDQCLVQLPSHFHATESPSAHTTVYSILITSHAPEFASQYAPPRAHTATLHLPFRKSNMLVMMWPSPPLHAATIAHAVSASSIHTHTHAHTWCVLASDIGRVWLKYKESLFGHSHFTRHGWRRAAHGHSALSKLRSSTEF